MSNILSKVPTNVGKVLQTYWVVFKVKYTFKRSRRIDFATIGANRFNQRNYGKYK